MSNHKTKKTQSTDSNPKSAPITTAITTAVTTAVTPAKNNTYPFSEVSGFTGSKIFDSLLLYGIENCDRLRKTTDTDTFPLDKYYDLEGKLGHTKGDNEKKKSPFNTGRHGKVIIQYICSRFTWEVKQINIKNFNPVAIPQFILNGVSEMEFNISHLIVNTVEKVPISNLIKKSHGLEQELMTKIGAHIDDVDLNFYVAKTLVRFIKILAFNFSNEFWYNNARTIGERNFRTVLAGCEAYLPSDSVSFHGIMNEMTNFLKDNVKKIEKGKKATKESAVDEESKDNEEEGGDTTEDAEPENTTKISAKSPPKTKKKSKSNEKKKNSDDDEAYDSPNYDSNEE
jgi:hypothetical protein